MQLSCYQLKTDGYKLTSYIIVTTKKKPKLDIHMIKRKESKQNTSKHHHQQKLRKKETKKSQNNQKSMNKVMMGSINTYIKYYWFKLPIKRHRGTEYIENKIHLYAAYRKHTSL